MGLSHPDISGKFDAIDTPEVASVTLTSTYTIDESLSSTYILDVISEELQGCEVINRRVTKIEFKFYSQDQEFNGEVSVNQVGANEHPEDIEPVEQRQSDRIRLKIENEDIQPDGKVRNLSVLLNAESEFSAKFESVWDNERELSLTCRFNDPVADDVVRVRKKGYRLEMFRNNFRMGDISPHRVEQAVDDFYTVIDTGNCDQLS